MTEHKGPLDLERVRQWRDRAEEFRAAAEGMQTPVRYKMLAIARDWDRMADNLETRLREERGRREP
jgi:hypothetical protein